MAEVDTAMLSKEHGDIRREAAIGFADTRYNIATNAGDIKDTVRFEGQENVMATKDARHDILSGILPAVDASGDRIVDRIAEGRVETADRFFAVGRDTADLRAQVIQAIDTTKLSTELNSLKGIIEGQRNTQYLADRISADGEKTRSLITDLKYHDLNRALVERQTELLCSEQDRNHWRHGAEQAQWGAQFAQLQSMMQNFNSQLAETRQGMVNFGTMAGVGQTSTSNNVR